MATMPKRRILPWLRLLKKVRYPIGLIIALVVLVGTASASTTVWDYHYGTVNGVNWDGRGHITWDAGSGGVDYYGDSFTETPSQTIDTLEVRSVGRELCWSVVTDTEWDQTNSQSNTWIVGAGGSGWVQLGQCSGLVNVTISNYGWHRVTYGASDTGETDAFDYLPW